MSSDNISLHQRKKAFDIVWSALYGYREDCIPDSDEMYNEQWDDICEAMAHIQEVCEGEHHEL